MILLDESRVALAVYPLIYPTVLLESLVARKIIDSTNDQIDSKDEAAHHRASQVWDREEQQHIVEEALNK